MCLLYGFLKIEMRAYPMYSDRYSYVLTFWFLTDREFTYCTVAYFPVIVLRQGVISSDACYITISTETYQGKCEVTHTLILV